MAGQPGVAPFGVADLIFSKKKSNSPLLFLIF
jgi:hypothetical protein